MENVYLDYSNILSCGKFNLINITSQNFIHLDKIKQKNTSVETLNINGHFDLIAAIKLYLLIRKYSPKLIIAHNGRVFATINLCRKLFNLNHIQFIAVTHGGNAKRILNFDYIITVAKHLQHNLKSLGFKGKIKNIYNGIKINPYSQTKSKNHNIFTFGILSRLSPEKNLATAIKAFHQFTLNTHQNSQLIIAGDGDELNNLQEIVTHLNITNKVKFIKWINDKKSFFNKINVLLQPSLHEAFGLTILESFNYYTPVIAYKLEGPKEIIKHHYNGYLCNPELKNSLLSMMTYSYKNKNNFKTLTLNAYKDLNKRFSYTQMETELISFVTPILYQKYPKN